MLTPKGESVLARLCPAGVRVAFSLFAISIMLTGCASPPAAPAPSQPSGDSDTQPPDEASEAVFREIEEADIVKFEDGYFYLANRWTGLRIIDARTIERPLLAGRVTTQGRAVELFVRDEHAFMLSSADFFYCAGQPVGFEDDAAALALTTPDYAGSRITVVDVSDKQAPAVVAEFDLDGFVSATRRVGDVIYAAGSYREDYVLPDDDHDADTNGDASTNGTDGSAKTAQVTLGLPRAFVASVNVGDPDSPYLVDREVFFGDSFEINVSTQNAMFVAGVDPTMTKTTLVTYVDISDPEGDVRLRDQFRVPGVIRNRFFMDQYYGVFRIVVEVFEGFYPTIWTVSLFHYDVSNPDNITRLARLPLVENQGMRSVRFDGPRAYAATSTVSDPLFVLDLSDPADPTVAGQLEIVGVSTHLVPLGDRLLNFGVDNTWGRRRPSVTLFDVSDPREPQPMSRVVLGSRGDRITSEANFDERAMQVLEDEQLVLVPFTYYDSDRFEYVDGVQMVDLLPTRLRECSQVTHRGLVRRSGIVDERLWILSDEAFKVTHIDDRDDPRDLAALDIITDQELLDLGLWACVDSARMQDGLGLYDSDYFFWYGRPLFCGAGVPTAAMLMALGLVGFRWAGRWR